jgi:hypothetical protein
VDAEKTTQRQREIDGLFQRRAAELQDPEPLPDGIFDVPKYIKSKYRILFISKEPNNPGAGKNYRELLLPENNSFWTPLKYAAFGILNGIYDWKEIPFSGESPFMEILSYTAFMNISKIPSGDRAASEYPGAGARTDMEKLAQKYSQYRDILEAQIALLEPDVVICLGTFGVIKPSLIDGFFEAKPKLYRELYVKKGRIVFDCFFSRHVKREFTGGEDLSKGICEEAYYHDIFQGFKSREKEYLNGVLSTS